MLVMHSLTVGNIAVQERQEPSYIENGYLYNLSLLRINMCLLSAAQSVV